ncbi:MAG: GNAT family N-acetyltransferase [Alphaproteobacteria bacterium]|nr:GNAT family N-acetyltransferase [Alphaproteobacteria bacterium]
MQKSKAKKLNNQQPTTNNQQPTMRSFTLRKARLEDFEEIYSIFTHILEEGETYSYTLSEMTPERSLAYWISAPGTQCFVADVEGKVAAVCALRPNRTGRGGHVANASFIVHPDYRRQGIARAMGEHVLKQAKKSGYDAIQYNFVVSVNTVAVNLWKSLGFKVIGTMPKGFKHARKGLVDVLIMHQFL